MTRPLRVTPLYRRAADRLRITTGSTRGRAVGRVLGALMTDASLPGPGDVRALRPPTREAFVRRVPKVNLWVWYVVLDGVVFVVGLTTDPPVPLDE